ncbi:LptF/LptG family permease [Phycisphaera mikurensis]|uniref:Permease n=1 Tax=Phycisphaera mikurensis (strain NBRC 102666 / KCTC 22515 / FYK2301M01) TaxID=1142394 RepID=I0IEQ1_PHYMF|nr:LptF/LptG family permease [Phycisphaera mikurensis]MBB6441535.1 lipopolysaccharide export system permease protein [Phycisphaera mikurensis]BAM03739.1 hypothetical protein PSMK_15800 [Phycisphaera mikurensis NBRC 102666]
MRTLDAYLVRLFLLNFVVLLAVLMTLFVLVDFIVDIDEFLQAGVAWAAEGRFGGSRLFATVGAVLSYYGPQVLLIYVFLSGPIVVGAMGFTFTQLTRQRELLAMLAGGISLHRVGLPVIAAGAVLAAATLPMQEFVLPRLAGELLRTKAQLKNSEERANPVVFVPDGSGNLWSAADFAAAAKPPRLTKLRVLQRDGSGGLERLVLAEEALWAEDARAVAMNAPITGRWELIQGDGLRPPAVPASGVAGGGGGERELQKLEPVPYLQSQLSPEVLVANQAALLPSVLSLRRLQALASNEALAPRQRATFTRTVWGRFSLLILNVLLLVIALPFFLRRVPGDAMKLSVQACGVVLGAWAGGILMLQASPAALPPVVSAWIPVAAYLPVAAFAATRIRT